MSVEAYTTLAPETDDKDEVKLLKKQLALRRRITGTALVSAARTTTTQSSDIEIGSAGAITIFLNITAIAGTGVRVNLLHKDPLTGAYASTATTLAAITTTGLKVYCIGQGGMAAPSGLSMLINHGVFGTMLPETVRIEITHTDGNSITYSLSYVLR